MKILNSIFLLPFLFSAYTFFLLHLFARWLAETFYSVWGLIPGSEMIQLSLSGCCLGRAYARLSTATELEKSVKYFIEATKKISSREENTDAQRSVFMDFGFTVHVYLAAYRLAGWRAWIVLAKTQSGSAHHEIFPPKWNRSSKRLDFIQNHRNIITDHTHEVPSGKRYFLTIPSGAYFRLINRTLKLQENRTELIPAETANLPKEHEHIASKELMAWLVAAFS